MIIPAILEKEFREVENKVGRVKDICPWIQIDVTDGFFTQGKTFELELLRKSDLDLNAQLFDIHLMTRSPERWIEKCIFVGASRIVGQVEQMENREIFVTLVKDEGMEAGLAFDIETEVDNVPEDTDVILLMGRKAGFGRIPLDDRLWEKLERVNEYKKTKSLKFKVGVDGGINLENIRKLKEAGVDIFYCTAAIFDGNTNVNIENLKDEIK